MGGKQSKTKRNYPKLPEREAKEQWEEEWETFHSSHPGFTVSDVNWEENVEKNFDEEQIRIVCISDTHCQVFNAISHQDMNIPHQAQTMLEPGPPGDILIHAGDFTNYGRKKEVEKFNEWLGSLPHRWSRHNEPTLTLNSRHKIVIAGNHEITFDRKSFDNPYAKRKVFGENYDPADLEVGHTDSITVDL